MTRDPDQGVYGISVAADLVGLGVQTLRLYETRGLVSPARTEGGTRRYSDTDLRVLERIRELLESGLNLAGVAMVLDLEQDNAQLRDDLAAAVDDGTARGTAGDTGGEARP